jgi:NADPH:quinone reductase-like Zn-dependent oxidoreductase
MGVDEDRQSVKAHRAEGRKLMRAVVYRRFGGPDVLEHVQLPEPRTARGSILVRVRAAGMNDVDLALRAGAGADCMETWFPVVPGWDVAGVVERVGEEVREFEEGDEVVGLLRNDVLHVGTYVEKVSAPARCFVRKPGSLGWPQAAALPLAGLTAWQCVTHWLRIRSGETLMVHGCDGSVGSIAMQLALRAGARAIGSCPIHHHSFITSLGAEPVVPGEDLVTNVRALAPGGVDAVLDCMGGGTLHATWGLSRAGARRVSIAELHDEIRTVYAPPDLEALDSLVALAGRGELLVRVAATYPLAFAESATRFLASGCAMGKVVLTLA